MGVWNVRLAPILVSTVQSSKYYGWTADVARCCCPALGGRQRAVTISGVSSVACHVRHCCPVLWSSGAFSDDIRRSLFRLSGSA